MKVLVTGGRGYGVVPKDTNDVAAASAQACREVAALTDALDDLRPKLELVIHGGATGADAWADRWARAKGVPVKAVSAPWPYMGNGAGVMRNSYMLDQHKPDLVVAFPGCEGTENCIRQALMRGVPVKRIKL